MPSLYYIIHQQFGGYKGNKTKALEIKKCLHSENDVIGNISALGAGSVGSSPAFLSFADSCLDIIFLLNRILLFFDCSLFPFTKVKAPLALTKQS